jgi:hypothetical protein
MALFKSKRKKAQELFETGSKGAGTVVQVQNTGMTINDKQGLLTDEEFAEQKAKRLG